MKNEAKEENVWWIFARLGWLFRSVLGSRANDAYRKDWPFPLIVSTEGNKFRYDPRSYFHVSVDGLVHLSVEVQSGVNEGDRYRMLLQAACAARLGRRFYNKPFIVMALYIEESGAVTQYLLFQHDDNDLTVSYVSSVQDWTKPSELFHAMFEIYNLALTIPSEVSEGGRVASLKSDLLENFRESFLKRKRTRDDTSNGLQHGEQVYDDHQVLDALTRAGYTLESNDKDENGWAPLNQLRPTMRHATRSTGDAVVVKLVHARSDELEILQHLHSTKSPYNHTIPLLDTLKLNVGTFIFLPEATPLGLGFAFGMFRSDVLDFSRQLIDGVAYLHSRGIAHLDIKPQNIVAFPKQLFIIDFDIAVRVDGVDSLIDRWCGTPEWMAPEIGREDGPKCSYSPIRADLWSCGLMLRYLASKGAVDNLIEGLAYRLLNKSPRLRPLLHQQSSFTVGHSLGEGRMK